VAEPLALLWLSRRGGGECVCAGSLRSKCRLSTSLSALVCHVSLAQSKFYTKERKKESTLKANRIRRKQTMEQNGTIRKQNGTKYKHQQEQQE
jgi:hypothetical protein